LLQNAEENGIILGKYITNIGESLIVVETAQWAYGTRYEILFTLVYI
jgi:hypothetical protein